MDEAKTIYLHNGNLYMFWKELFDMLEPSTPFSRLTLKKQLQLTSASLDHDIFIFLSLIWNYPGKNRRHSRSLLIMKIFVMQIINNHPLEYDTLVKAIGENMNKELTDQIAVK